ncbi:MAG TPA: oxidoreductase [Pseudonocardiaceae bacterium]|jgi:aryl-alcohol dehydrogenase-like predicted oxidoreductase|nr:oxidoreductase [Pseudonocardiaceae bacterium]
MTTNITAAAAGSWLLGGDLPVHRIGYGTMRLPAWPAGNQPDREQALAVLRRAVELGVNHIDTAAFYARDGVSANELIKAALHPYPAGLVLVTKVGPRFGPDGAVESGLSLDQLRAAVETNLTELGVDRLDLVNLRVGGLEPTEQPIGAAFEALATLRAEGLIRHLGISNVAEAQLDEALAIAPVASVQNMFNIEQRADSALVDRCAAEGISYVPYFPVGGFQLVNDPALAAVAARHGVTPPQVALAWLLARSPSILLIAGTSSVTHLEENVAAGGLTLTETDLTELDSVRSAQSDAVG